jgi:hypothetical protein
MIDRRELTANFSDSSIGLMHEAVAYAVKVKPMIVQQDVVSWEKWARELESIMDEKKLTYTRIEFTRM